MTRSAEGDKVTEYLYDNAGNRFIKKGPEGTTLYLRHGQIAVAMDIEVPVEQTECVGKINRYVMSGDLLAGRITTTVKSDGTKEVSLYYYHLDHLNSTKIVSDEEGAVDVRYVYRAFGEQLAKIGEGDARYTYSGKELDDETNLYYFNARYYDALIGRFISEDPAHDGLNWYVYADNNPLMLVDPTGLFAVEIYSKEIKRDETIIQDNMYYREINHYAYQLEKTAEGQGAIKKWVGRTIDVLDKVGVPFVGWIGTGLNWSGAKAEKVYKDVNRLQRNIMDRNPNMAEASYMIKKVEVHTQKVHEDAAGLRIPHTDIQIDYFLIEKNTGLSVDITGSFDKIQNERDIIWQQ